MSLRKYFDTVLNPQGQPVEDATVQVNQYPGGGAASLYSDAAGVTPIANPVLTDANGFYSFYVASGHYTLITTTTSDTTTNNDVTIGPVV